MPRRIKETLSSAGERTKSVEVDKSMTVKDKISILAMSRRGMGKRATAGLTGFAMDWISVILDVFACDRDFCAEADKLNAGRPVDTDAINDGLGGAKRG